MMALNTTDGNPRLARLCEIAYVDVSAAAVHSDRDPIAAWGHTLIRPPCPISPLASARHHITDATVAAAPSWESARANMKGLDRLTGWVAHGAGAARALTGFEGTWMCSERLARHLYPAAPSYDCQALRYWLGLETGLSQEDAPHRALARALVCAMLFAAELQALAERCITEPAVIAAFAERAVLSETPGRGEYAAIPWGAIPAQVLQSLFEGENDLDEDATLSLRHELQRRSEAQALVYESTQSPPNAELTPRQCYRSEEHVQE